MSVEMNRAFLFDPGTDGGSGTSPVPEDHTKDDKPAEGKTTPEAKPAQTEATPEAKSETTKAFSARLAQETAKIKAAERERIAKENGYESYDEFNKANLAAKVKKETAYDPTDADFSKLLDIVKGEADPEKETLKEQVASYQKAEQDKWDGEQVAAIYSAYGVKVGSVAELDEDVKAKIAKGIDPVDAYWLVHKPAPKKAVQDDDKSHLKADPQGGPAGKDAISDSEIEVAQQINPDLDRKTIVARIKALRENK